MTINEETLKHRIERPLPLAAAWNTGLHPDNAGYDAQNMVNRISADGHYILPTITQPNPKTTSNLYNWSPYYADNLNAVKDAGLPIVLSSTQWEKLLADMSPNVLAVDTGTQKVSPFGPIEPWYEVGKSWITNWKMQRIQEEYPNPPAVIFLSNNEHYKLRWIDAETDQRYVDQYGTEQTDEFKRRLFGNLWLKRYRALQQGMLDGMSEEWRHKAKFVGYNAFGQRALGRWSDWVNHSLHSENRFSPWPSAWDGASLSYYVNDWNSMTDHTVWSPQVEFQNLVFALDEVYQKQAADFWFELSVWDGGQTQRDEYIAAGQTFTPDRYKGYMKFGMWLLRPRVVREFRGWTTKWEDEGDYFLAVADACKAVHDNATLSDWWRNGELVPNTARQHPYQNNIPTEYQNVNRWFMLESDANAATDWGDLSSEIKVFSLSLRQGKAPNRRWLVYAHSPVQARTEVVITIPEFQDITVDVPVNGAFYLVEENPANVQAV